MFIYITREYVHIYYTGVMWYVHIYYTGVTSFEFSNYVQENEACSLKMRMMSHQV